LQFLLTPLPGQSRETLRRHRPDQGCDDDHTWGGCRANLQVRLYLLPQTDRRNQHDPDHEDDRKPTMGQIVNPLERQVRRRASLDLLPLDLFRLYLFRLDLPRSV
jgi:hypothetical protein